MMAAGFWKGGGGFLKTGGEMVKGGGNVNREIRVGVTHVSSRKLSLVGTIKMKAHII